MKNHFEIFDLPQQFDVDLMALDAKYFELQRMAHPDMAGGAEVDSAVLNNAYKVLKNRFKRAEYLVELSGSSELAASPELLMEMMELREDVSAESVAKARAEMDDLFARFAAENSTEIFVRMKYLKRFIMENSGENS